MQPWKKTLLVWVALIVLFVALFLLVSGDGEAAVPGGTLLLWLVVIVVVLAVAVAVIRRMRGGAGAGDILSLRKSRARLLPEQRTQTFADVGGAEEAKRDLADVIDFLRRPDAWRQAGARPPRGLLLEGPPGCGKTLLGRAVAGEAKVPFFFVSASEFVEMFVGVGAARVRDTFEQAGKKAPCIVFIDELDAVGRRRGSGVGSAHDEREQTLNQLLFCMDGFETDARVVVIAATNRPDILDQALLRPGRLDRRIRVPLPDRAARVQILKVHAKGKPIGGDVSAEELADRLEGANGADLENLVNEAAMLALRRHRGESSRAGGLSLDVSIGRVDFDAALAKRAAGAVFFDHLDQIVVESASQLAQPVGRVVLRATLRDGAAFEGEVVWADGHFVKLRRADGESVILAKREVVTLEPCAGTEAVAAVTADAWAHRQHDLA
jgi:SpoVK/Ycf46/Vps4 family AAA+-type ATPase